MDILDLKTKEFIGIAASVAGHCQPCFDYHFAEAKKLGVTLEEVKATVKIAQAVRQAGNNNMDKYIQTKLGA
ncbi:MAG: carboxymuconolactone decarboxylase family protein [Candidatus Helarchaeota archaeon]|nr:carboxymuconolactone decarboxylase family protein [Candidatus Helarchaeota archaeon]